jgi:hypothetical protein
MTIIVCTDGEATYDTDKYYYLCRFTKKFPFKKKILDTFLKMTLQYDLRPKTNTQKMILLVVGAYFNILAPDVIKKFFNGMETRMVPANSTIKKIIMCKRLTHCLLTPALSFYHPDLLHLIPTDSGNYVIGTNHYIAFFEINEEFKKRFFFEMLSVNTFKRSGLDCIKSLLELIECKLHIDSNDDSLYICKCETIVQNTCEATDKEVIKRHVFNNNCYMIKIIDKRTSFFDPIVSPIELHITMFIVK